MTCHRLKKRWDENTLLNKRPHITAADASCPHQTLRARLTAPDGSLSVHLLPSAAGHRPQHSFSHALFTHLLRHLLSPASGLSTLALARLRHAAMPPSPMLFQMYYIPTTSALTNVGVQYRLLPPPRRPSPLPPIAAPAAMPPALPQLLSEEGRLPAAVHHLLAHAYHQSSCGATPRRHKRHDVLAKIIGQAATTYLSALHDLHRRLSSSTGEAATKVDLVITLHSTYPPVTA